MYLANRDESMSLLIGASDFWSKELKEFKDLIFMESVVVFPPLWPTDHVIDLVTGMIFPYGSIYPLSVAEFIEL